MRTDDGLHVLAANLTPWPQRLRLGPLPAGRAALRLLDDAHADAALGDPERYRGQTQPIAADGDVELALEPYAVARIDVTAR